MKNKLLMPSLSKTTIIISSLVLIVLVMVIFIRKGDSSKDEIKDNKGNEFVGSASCANCHKDIFDSHVKTAHFLTSQPASAKYIKGSFSEGENIFPFGKGITVAMEKKDSTFYQVEYHNGESKKRRRFNIVVGSGTKGQTYLYWMNKNLFQLPISYFTATNQWANSPGFPGKVIFNRPITSRCLECHSTFASKLSDPGVEPEKFDANRIIYGVDCEKCHGPAQKHVQYQAENPTVKIAKYIINPSTFTRQQSLDMCSLCHGGRLNKTSESFSFSAGEKLSDYFTFDTAVKDAADIDVHGNQFGLLAASECFKKSDLTCVTCHNTHKNEAGDLALFSNRCLNCHNDQHSIKCKLANKLGNKINANCIDCHMPNQSSKAVTFLLPNSTIPTAAAMRTHYIKVYPEETKKVLAFMNKQKEVKRDNIQK